MATGKGTTTEADVIAFMFNATAMPSYGATLYVSLHTANPGAGNQTTSEAAYGGYARQPVVRTNSGWTCSANSATNVAAITFPQCVSGSETETYVAIGTALSGAGQILYYGQLSSSLAVSSGIQPQFAIGQLTISES